VNAKLVVANGVGGVLTPLISPPPFGMPQCTLSGQVDIIIQSKQTNIYTTAADNVFNILSTM